MMVPEDLLRSAPLSLARFSGCEHTVLGQLLEFRVWIPCNREEVEEVAFEVERPYPPLLWCEDEQILWWIMGLEMSEPAPIGDHDGPGARALHRWTHFRRKANSVQHFKFDDTGRAWWRLPDMSYIAYRSDRQHARGDTDDYKHLTDVNFDDDAEISFYRCGDADDPTAMYIVRGLELTETGIHG